MKRVLLVVIACFFVSACTAQLDPSKEAGRHELYPIFDAMEPERGIVKVIRVDGIYYYEAGASELGVRCGVMDGLIRSDPEPKFPYGIPTNDNEANFGVAENEYGYQLSAEENELELLDSGDWRSYKAVPSELKAGQFDYVYTLGDEEKWLIFSDLWLDFNAVKTTLHGADSGITETFSFFKI